MFRYVLALILIVFITVSGQGESSLPELNPLEYLGVRQNPTDTPHVLLGIPTPDTPLERTLEQFLLFETQGQAQKRWSPMFTNLAPKREHTIYGKPIQIIYADWIVRKGSGVEYLEYLNPGLGRELWTIDELDKLDAAMSGEVKTAVDHIWERLQPEQIESDMLKQLSKQLDMSVEVVTKELDRMVDLEGGYQVTTREFMNIPSFDKADFVPDVLIVAAMPEGIFAATTVGTWGGKRVVLYSPTAWQYDRILGDNMVMQHELVHANSQIQSVPFSFYVDVELFAELSSLMMDLDPFELYFHGYLEPVRRAIRALWSFDTREAAKQLYDFNVTGMVTIKEDKFYEFYENIQVISAELKRFVREVLYPTFYAQPLFWTSLAVRLCESYAPFDVMISMAYEPTILGGPASTAKWLAQYENQIIKVAEKALREAGEKKENPEELSAEFDGFSVCPMATVPMPTSTLKLWQNEDFIKWFTKVMGVDDAF